MSTSFAEVLSKLRKEKKMSQRVAARELEISQALLSHYENGLREPKLDFVIKVCEYYNVSADYLLGRTEVHENPAIHCQDTLQLDPKSVEIWDNENVRMLLNGLAELFSWMCNNVGEQAFGKLFDYFNIGAYKVVRQLDILNDDSLAEVMQIPTKLFDLRCKTALLQTEAEIYDIMAKSFNSDENQSYLELKAMFPEIYKETIKWLSSADSTVAELLNRGIYN